MSIILNLLLQMISYPLPGKNPKIPGEFFLSVLNLQNELGVTATVSLQSVPD